MRGVAYVDGEVAGFCQLEQRARGRLPAHGEARSGERDGRSGRRLARGPVRRPA